MKSTKKWQFHILIFSNVIYLISLFLPPSFLFQFSSLTQPKKELNKRGNKREKERKKKSTKILSLNK